MNLATGALSLLADGVGLEPAAWALEAVNLVPGPSAGKVTAYVMIGAAVLVAASATVAIEIQKHTHKRSK